MGLLGSFPVFVGEERNRLPVHLWVGVLIRRLCSLVSSLVLSKSKILLETNISVKQNGVNNEVWRGWRKGNSLLFLLVSPERRSSKQVRSTRLLVFNERLIS